MSLLLQLSFFFNLFFFSTTVILGIKYYQMQSLDSANVHSHLAKLEQQIEILNSKKDLIPLSNELSQITSTEGFNIIMLKIVFIVGLLFLTTWLLYFLSTSFYAFFFQSSVGQLVALSNKLMLQLLGCFSFLDIKELSYSDKHGNEIIVSSLSDGTVAEILVKGVEMESYVPLADFITVYGSTVAGSVAANPEELAALLEHINKIF